MASKVYTNSKAFVADAATDVLSNLMTKTAKVLAKCGLLVGLAYAHYHLFTTHLELLLAARPAMLGIVILSLVINGFLTRNLVMHDKYGFVSLDSSTCMIGLCVVAIVMLVVIEQAGPEKTGEMLVMVFKGFAWMWGECVQTTGQSAAEFLQKCPTPVVIIGAIVYLWQRSLTTVERCPRVAEALVARSITAALPLAIAN
jgi:hypothetical protein